MRRRRHVARLDIETTFVAGMVERDLGEYELRHKLAYFSALQTPIESYLSAVKRDFYWTIHTFHGMQENRISQPESKPHRIHTLSANIRQKAPTPNEPT